MSPARPARPGRAGQLVTVLAAAALFRAAQNVGQTTDPLLGRQLLHLSPSVIGSVMTGSLAVSVLVNATVATRVPVHRLRAAISIGSALLAGSLVAFAVAHSVVVFTAAALALGAAGGLALPSLASAAGTGLTGRRRDRVLALYALALSGSLGLGPLLEAVILAQSGNALRAPFLAFAPLALIAILAMSGRRMADREPARAAASGRVPVRELFAIPGWRLAVTVNLLYALPFVAVTTFGALLARQDYGASPAQAALMFTAFFAASLLARGSLAIVPMARFTGLLVAASALATIAGLLLLALGHGLTVLIIAVVVLGVPHGVTFPVVLGLVARSVPAGQLPSANALLLAVANGSTVFAPSVLGLIAGHEGYRSTMLVVLLPAVAFGSLLVHTLSRHPQLR